MSDTEAKKQTKTKGKRFRSPPYPSIPLKKAAERAAELYAKALHHSVPVSVLASAWDYGEKSSGLYATAAALKQFGLLTDEGSGDKRRFRLTDRAMRIARDPDPKSEKRIAALRDAALSPKIHAELWKKYEIAGAVGSMDVALKSHLTLDRADDGEAPYSDTAADEVIGEYKDTIAFAGLLNSANITDEDHEEEETANLDDPDDGEQEYEESPPPETKKRRQDGVSIMENERELTTGLLAKDSSFRLIVSGKIGAKEIDRLIAKLELDKEILAEPDEENEAAN